MNHQKEVLNLAISLYNSYFTEDRITRLLQHVASPGRKIYLVIVDLPVAHNLRAIGKGDSYIKRRMLQHGNNMANRCRRAIENSGVEATIVNWKIVSSSSVYLEGVEIFRNLYDQDARFRFEARKVTSGVLFNKLEVRATEQQIDVAVSFVLEELAFFWWGDQILGEDNLVNAYHSEMKILSDLIAGAYNIEARPNISHRVISVE
jgi:cyclo(L-tyrosyl-L-tyrosyl) synthase